MVFDEKRRKENTFSIGNGGVGYRAHIAIYRGTTIFHYYMITINRKLYKQL